MNKEDLREQFKTARLAVPIAEVKAKSKKIIETLITQTDWSKIKSVHTYSAIKKLNEVDTADLIKYLQAKQPNIAIAIAGKLSGSQAPSQKFDLIVVPTLAFDKNLNRLGWGGGWYDKFLATQPQALKIGLAYESSCLMKIPAETHDTKLDQIITEQRIITRS